MRLAGLPSDRSAAPVSTGITSKGKTPLSPTIKEPMREQIQASSRSLLNRCPQDSASLSHREPELAATWLLGSCWASQATIRNKESVPSSRSFCLVIAKWSQPGWPISENGRGKQSWKHAQLSVPPSQRKSLGHTNPSLQCFSTGMNTQEEHLKLFLISTQHWRTERPFINGCTKHLGKASGFHYFPSDGLDKDSRYPCSCPSVSQGFRKRYWPEMLPR